MRDELLAAVRRRIEAVDRSGDPAGILTDEALAEADRLLGFLAATPDLDSEIAHTAGLFHLLRAAARGEEADETMASVLLVPVYLTAPASLPDQVRSAIAEMTAQSSPEELVAEARNNLAMLLLQRRVRLGEDHGLAPAENLLRMAVEALPPENPSRALALCNLGYARLLSDPEDVGEIIALFRAALPQMPDGDPNRARCANGLALALRAKGGIPLLIEAIGLFRTAVNSTTDDDENLPNMLACLAESLLAWWTQVPDADQAAPDEAIAALERALVATPPGSEEFAQRSALLEQVHLARATRDARARENRPEAQALSENFTKIFESFVGPSGEDDPVGRFIRMFGLTGSSQLDEFNQVLQRYPRDATMADVQRKALDVWSRRFEDLDPDQVPSALAAAMTGGTAPLRHQVDLSSLAEIAALHEQLLRELPGDHPDRVMVQLSHSHLSMVRLSAELEPTEQSMDRATAQLATVLSELPKAFEALSRKPGVPDLNAGSIEQMVSLGHALTSPFESLAVIDREIKRYRRRLGELPEHDPEYLRTCTYLTHTLFARCRLTGEDDVFAEAVALTRQVVAATSPPEPKLVSDWGKTAAERLYRASFGGPARSSGVAALAARAAADSVAGGDPAGALESLDDGRAILLHEALRTRDQLDELRRADPALAERLAAVRAEIRAGMNPGMEPRPAGIERFRAQAAEWEKLTGRAKALPGFDRFLGHATQGIRELAPAAADGPVVAVNVEASRCDALVLRNGRVRGVPLPDLRAAELAEQTEAFQDAVTVLSGQSPVDGMVAGSARRTVLDTLGWLWDVLAEPVLTDLGMGEHEPGSPWPRLWWSPTGPLAFLPLHAAGHHDKPGASVLDRVVSSYTPTVRALLHSRARPAAPKRTTMAVAVPETPGHAALPETVREATALAVAFPGPPPLSGEAATRQAVCDALPGAAIAHFACHASSDPDDATASHLLLHDGPLTVTEISRLRLDHAELAYLSACATARGSTVLADEAVHIASAFQLAGYAQAIGTLWEVRDSTAARIAEDFHRELAATIDDPVRPAGALALHTAVRRLRGEPDSRPWEWAAYVHAGA
ncbi:CHAT domain-containing protein [Amycolatopsis alkalitolerans]|uniref:CHAT domain-containing protein n=1 Tax=Amycolatopsis alkalitolerans TaxID=2547244 RepID=A0A5C4M137_9PSEU|nr:CHAT domain-containing protein [Amycolatopsis alkalitolerans]TNC26421.1 CHAT domain-containing protein [Amycolatopsis alkalitolerans]